MGLGGCYSVIKYLLVIFNLLFWILGIAGVVFGIWMLVDPTFSLSLTQESTDYTISVIIILVASILLVIVAGLGVFGSLKESHCVLITFFSLLLVIFVAEVSAGVWAYINSESLELEVKKAVKQTVEYEYDNNPNRKVLFDTFQKNLHCCGSEGPTDWMRKKTTTLQVSADPETITIPETCCREGVTAEKCRVATHNVKVAGAIDFNVVYDRGCYNLIISKLKEHAYLLLAVGIGIASIQVLGLIFSLVLAFAVNRANRHKAY